MPPTTPTGRDCPSDDCKLCSGEACNKCGAGCWNNDPDLDCRHDILQRHEEAE